MSGLSSIMDAARRALASQRIGMNVTSHNIANAGTAGFSRQRVEFTASTPVRTPFGVLGTGVTVAHVGRIRDRFIDQQIRVANDSLGSASAQHHILSQIEAVFNEPSDTGLGAVMTRFFNSFQDLAAHPEDATARNSVFHHGVQLSQSFRRLNSSLTQHRSSLVDDIESKVRRINQLTQEISELDVQITGAIGLGGDPSDAKDQRDLKIEELSKLVNISVSEDSRGSVMISIGGMVVASRAGAVKLQTTVDGGAIKIATASSGKEVAATSGDLGGLLQLYNTVVPKQLSQVDELASAIINRVNTLHSAGYGLGAPPPTGIDFFTGTGAAGMDINPAIVADLNNIAASGDGSPGNNTVALALAGVANEPLLEGNSLSVTRFYTRLVSSIGSAITTASNTMSVQELVLVQLENQRSAVSGVSLDEEMTNLIKFQRAFDAAAKMITTTNEMFQTILQMV